MAARRYDFYFSCENEFFFRKILLSILANRIHSHPFCLHYIVFYYKFFGSVVISFQRSLLYICFMGVRDICNHQGAIIECIYLDCKSFFKFSYW